MIARWLTSRSQADWNVWAGITGPYKVVEANVLQLTSQQCPNGYEVCRVEAEILKPEHLGLHRSKGDAGHESQGYHNEWKIVQVQEVKPAERDVWAGTVLAGASLESLGL